MDFGKMIERKDVTIIIPHLGITEESRYSLNECLTLLNETVPDIRKIVSFNAAPENLGENIFKGPLQEYDFLMVADQGQCKAVNAAIATTGTSWVIVMNDDMMVSPNWFENLIDFSDEDILCVSPKLIEPRGGAPTFETYFCGGAGGDFDKQKWLEFAKTYSLRGESDKTVRTGFNLPFLIKRELWDIIGGYDIAYDPWGSNSDSDLEYKIKLAGVQPMQNQRSIVYHFSQTSGTFEPRNQSYWQRNFAYFKEKWGFDRTDQGIWEASFEIPLENKFQPWWESRFSKGKLNVGY